jgi:hypothetical protein
VQDLGSKVNAALFGGLRIQYFLKKVANCELVHYQHCQNARESNAVQWFSAVRQADVLLDIRDSMLTDALQTAFHIFGQRK